jgi:hypothetical protein
MYHLHAGLDQHTQEMDIFVLVRLTVADRAYPVVSATDSHDSILGC